MDIAVIFEPLSYKGLAFPVRPFCWVACAAKKSSRFFMHRALLGYSEDEFARAVGWVLKRLRKQQRKLTQEKAAVMIGITRQYLTRLEGGHHNPKAYLLVSVSRVYDVSITKLFGSIAARAVYYAGRPGGSSSKMG